MSENQSNTSIKCQLYRVRLNNGGYDRNGAYWGIGNPLYACVPESCDHFNDWFLRARDRDHAKAVVIARWPKATFFR